MKFVLKPVLSMQLAQFSEMGRWGEHLHYSFHESKADHFFKVYPTMSINLATMHSLSLSLVQPNLHKRLPQGSAFSFTQQFSSVVPSLVGSDDLATPISPLKPMTSADWELHPSQVLVETRLGHGTFGDVFKGMVRGGVGLYKSKEPLCLNGVAIKLLKSE